MARCAFLFFLLLATRQLVFAQSELDPYKYVIVPKKFDFLQEEDQYRLNALTGFLFDKHGYSTLMEGIDYPPDVKENPCLAVTADVINGSNILTTKLSVVLKNCFGQVVFTSEEGTSKIKEYDRTYSDALRKCFPSIAALDYRFNPELVINRGEQQPRPEVVSKEEVKDPVEETLVEENKEPAVAASTVIAPVSALTPETVAPETHGGPVPGLAPVAAVVAEPPGNAPETKEENKAVGRIFSNGELTFLLTHQGDKLLAYVLESRSGAYDKGQLLGTFEPSSLEGVYLVHWVVQNGSADPTTAYFDASGSLKVDLRSDGKLEVLHFKQEK